MNITEAEKETLYQEFKERMIKESIEARPVKMVFTEAKELWNIEFAKIFKSEKDNFLKSKGFNGNISCDWDKIRLMVLHTYGVNTMVRLPAACYEEANQRALMFVKLYFEMINKRIDSE